MINARANSLIREVQSGKRTQHSTAQHSTKQEIMAKRRVDTKRSAN